MPHTGAEVNERKSSDEVEKEGTAVSLTGGGRMLQSRFLSIERSKETHHRFLRCGVICLAAECLVALPCSFVTGALFCRRRLVH